MLTTLPVTGGKKIKQLSTTESSFLNCRNYYYYFFLINITSLYLSKDGILMENFFFHPWVSEFLVLKQTAFVCQQRQGIREQTLILRAGTVT